MVEAVGHEYMEEFFSCCESVLAEDGLFVLQVNIPDFNNFCFLIVSREIMPRQAHTHLFSCAFIFMKYDDLSDS